MGKVVKSHANPQMLKWCREHSGLTSEEVAKIVRKDVAVIEEWEAGVGQPTLAQLRKLAKRYRRPLMVFYLPNAKQQFTIQKVKDFRKLPESQRTFSERLRLVIRRCQERQAWAAEFLEEEHAACIDLVGSIKRTESTSKVAALIRARLGVTADMIAGCADTRTAYNLWRTRIEKVGVFVFQSTGVSLDEMRGCALPDDRAPAMIINGLDSFSARIFTAIHELVHLALGNPSISGAGLALFDPSDTQATELFCNKVAGEVLVPTPELKGLVSGVEIDDHTLSRLATAFRVSRAVIAVRLQEISAVASDFIRERWAILFGPSQATKPDSFKDRKIPPYVLSLSRTGPSFSRLAVSAYVSGAIHGGELSSLLGLSMKHLKKLEARLAQPS